MIFALLQNHLSLRVIIQLLKYSESQPYGYNRTKIEEARASLNEALISRPARSKNRITDWSVAYVNQFHGKQWRQLFVQQSTDPI